MGARLRGEPNHLKMRPACEATGGVGAANSRILRENDEEKTAAGEAEREEIGAAGGLRREPVAAGRWHVSSFKRNNFIKTIDRKGGLR